MLLRDAVERDWPAIYPIFAAIVAEGKTYAYPEQLTSEEARAYWMVDPPGRTVVAIDEDELVGTAMMGPNRPGRGSHIATASFMVDPVAQGRGVGRLLGTHMLEWARAQGYRGVQFNAVVETNHAAVRRWESLGFRIIGTVPGAYRHAEHGYVGMHVMHRAL
jgi:L-amino acid N-acyltransferase YncA